MNGYRRRQGDQGRSSRHRSPASSGIYWLAVVVAIGAALLLWLGHRHLRVEPMRLFSAPPHRVTPDMAGVIPMPEAPLPEDRHSRVRNGHPRILLPHLSDWSGIGVPAVLQLRHRLYRTRGLSAYPVCSGASLPALASCWVETGDPALLEELTEELISTDPVTPREQEEYGNLWELALAYDFASLSPRMTPSERSLIEDKLRSGLQQALEMLDQEDLSLWHGRATVSANAWLGAVVLDQNDDRNRRLTHRAQGHFLEAMRALSLTEAWPEGFSYWVNNRGFPLVLAASAYLNGLQDPEYGDLIRDTLRRVGYWHIYATRPDGRIQGFADEGPRVDLKDETRRIIDLIVGSTRDPVLAAFSRYLERLHGAASYYPEYRWGFSLFNEPEIEPAAEREFLEFAGILPTAEVFGRDSMNLVYIRSGWSQADTFITFRAGGTFTHHGHYDAGAFTLFKGAPLAINSSVYGDYTGDNRLAYSIRTIAKNSLLVLRPGETVSDGRFLGRNVADGGQRVVLPTGSALTSVDEWKRNLGDGLHLEGGILESFEHRPGNYTYLSADLTRAYNTPQHDEGGSGGKVTLVRRELLYLDQEDRLAIFDQVASTEAGFVKKWIVHTVNRPLVADLKILSGDLQNGILESSASSAIVVNGTATLEIHRILPENALIRLVGGKDYQYYVERDGDETRLDGTNFIEGAIDRPWYDIGLWRIEIQPASPRKFDRFLTLLTPRLDEEAAVRDRPVSIPFAGGAGLATDKSVVLFLESEPAEPLEIELPLLYGELRIICRLCRTPLRLETGNSRFFLSGNGGAVYQMSRAGFAAGPIRISTVTD